MKKLLFTLLLLASLALPSAYAAQNPANGVLDLGNAQITNAGAASFRTVHTGTSNAVVSNSVAGFQAIDGASTSQPAATSGDASTIVPVETFKNLTCALYTAAGVLTVAGGTNYVVAFDDLTQSNTTITCTIAAAASSCSDTTHSFTTTALDQVAIIDTPTGTPTALVVKCNVESDL